MIDRMDDIIEIFDADIKERSEDGSIIVAENVEFETGLKTLFQFAQEHPKESMELHATYCQNSKHSSDPDCPCEPLIINCEDVTMEKLREFYCV